MGVGRVVGGRGAAGGIGIVLYSKTQQKGPVINYQFS